MATYEVWRGLSVDVEELDPPFGGSEGGGSIEARSRSLRNAVPMRDGVGDGKTDGPGKGLTDT